MNKQNLKFKHYFTRLDQALTNFNYKFLYFIPDLYKIDLRENKTPFKAAKFLSTLFCRSFLIQDLKKVKKAKICFISHYVGNKIADADDDFYYGNLFKNFKLKLPYYVLVINHTNESLNDIKIKFKTSKINRVFINANFNLLSHVSIYLKITKEFLYFWIIKFFQYKKIKLFKKIKINFNYKYFLNTKFTYKISNQLIKVLNMSKNLDYLMVTFEGHAFEKIIFNYCKKNRIKSFGYFFSIIREYKTNIYYNFSKDYQPDILFTSGDIAKKYFIQNSPHKLVETLGCSKNLSKINGLNILKNKKNKKLTILVCPEGLFSETVEMFELINNKILSKENFQFIFRTHPVINITNNLKKKLINKNIFFSEEADIQKDFKKSDFILYSGSSVCIQATMHGVIPINFKKKNDIFSLDPLYEVNRFIVHNKVDLKLKINSIFKKRHNKKLKNKIFSIKNYSSSYFKKINQNTLIKHVNIDQRIISN